MKPLELSLEPGRYVVAVSGGVDSVVLLDLLAQRPDLQLTVAHFDHGIREDSDLDQQLVAKHARRLSLPYVFDRGQLGIGTSEASARHARYEFLRNVQQASKAHALITAHHQDDLLETAVFNILRGTGRKGLSSLSDRHDLRRPLLHVPKADLQAYARDQGLVWREDSTNKDTTLTRNYIRHVLLPRLSEAEKKQLLAYVRHVGILNRSIDQQLATILHLQPRLDVLDRQGFIVLPHTVAREVLAAWLRSHGVRDFTRPALERLVVALKTGRPGTKADINAEFQLRIGQKEAQISNR